LRNPGHAHLHYPDCKYHDFVDAPEFNDAIASKTEAHELDDLKLKIRAIKLCLEKLPDQHPADDSDPFRTYKSFYEEDLRDFLVSLTALTRQLRFPSTKKRKTIL
jgi:hypothetical protein